MKWCHKAQCRAILCAEGVTFCAGIHMIDESEIMALMTKVIRRIIDDDTLLLVVY